MSKYVYLFKEGGAKMRDLLGGKGANLCEMTGLGMPVPPGFIITTEVCVHYTKAGAYPPGLEEQVDEALAHVEREMDLKFGDERNPLLLSCRSGARKSMPGMMETVLNVGLCSKTIPGLIEKTQNERFVYDAYRRLIMMYSDVVMEKAEGIELKEGEGIRDKLESLMTEMKKRKHCKQDTELTAEDLKELCAQFKQTVREVLGKDFPDDPREHLWGAIGAVFKSWNGKRAVSYRRIEHIPDDWGTATNVQAMVFGNMGETSATGVAFTRNPATGEDKFYGEWLPNAQGEDVVAGIRTPNPLNEETKNPQNQHLPSLESEFPVLYRELYEIRNRLEEHFKDMQDIEFTIQQDKLWMLQTRTGKRNGLAALRMAMQDHERGRISKEDRMLRVSPDHIEELLHPMLDPDEEFKVHAIAKGLPAGPGGAVGRVVFTANDAVSWTRKGEKVVLVREETNPEDVEGMRAAQAILTARGGMTSHAALVARGWGKCCIVGAADINIDAHSRTFEVGSTKIKEGDWISLNGTAGKVYADQLPLVDSEIVQVLSGKLDSAHSEIYRLYKAFMDFADGVRRLGVRTNADTPQDSAQAVLFKAEGIGLFRTEHMFYGKGSDEPLFLLRKMILSNTPEERRAAVDELYPFVKRDIKATLEVMAGLPVTIRLLDPPLHEFVPQDMEKQAELARALDIRPSDVKKRGEALHESNPMMGHRGVRLGITYPEITEMQVRAIFEASAELMKAGKSVKPEIMVPVTSDVGELDATKVVVDRVYDETRKKTGIDVPFLYGTMIEIPRACLLSDQMARTAEFFSFGTNDLTQMTFGFSRDDTGTFLPEYLKQGLLPADPFQTIDQAGVGQLIKMSVDKGRAVRPDLKIGICGEQGGDPASVEFCFRAGLNYVSCSPFRVPVARLAAAQASLKFKEAGVRGA